VGRHHRGNTERRRASLTEFLFAWTESERENPCQVFAGRGVMIMDSTSDSRTSPTLLSRLRADPLDQDAWGRFDKRYRPRIYAWCQELGLQEADALDVTQEVHLKLVHSLRSFAYDPARSFRGWLRTLTHHAWSDFLDSRRRAVQGSGDSAVLDRLKTVEAGNGLAMHLEQEFDLELLEKAEELVQKQVEPTTWEAYRLLSKEGASGPVAAALLGLEVAAVYVYKNRVRKKIQEALRRLERPHAGPGEEP
jgi:RNA polymerase sigma factor (sigma-70 family)